MMEPPPNFTVASKSLETLCSFIILHNAPCYDQITLSLFHQSTAPSSKMKLACPNVHLHTSSDSVCGMCAEKVLLHNCPIQLLIGQGALNC
ncbi:hypothetical protein UPYG_G00013040 [Umbra pygmaea]|uniref:Uncharacterized protein n=1 Tax=Umbra pygmaea TaxID=75934 RepID=A0ABD0XLC8_UMBPY